MNPSFRWLLLLLLILLIEAKKLPSIFFGRYTLEKSINLDEYLTARGYKWFTRRLILVASVTKVIRKAASGLPLRYDMETLTWKKDVRYTDFVLGTAFLTDHLEDGLFNVTIDVSPDGAVMTENVIRVEDPEDDETFEYTREGEYLIMQVQQYMDLPVLFSKGAILIVIAKVYIKFNNSRAEHVDAADVLQLRTGHDCRQAYRERPVAPVVATIGLIHLLAGAKMFSIIATLSTMRV